MSENLYDESFELFLLINTEFSLVSEILFINSFPPTLSGTFEVYQNYLGDYSYLDFAFLLKKNQQKWTPFIKNIFHFHSILFYLLNKRGQVLSSHHSLAGRSYPTFLHAVVHTQRKKYWAILLCFIKEKLPGAGGKKARFYRRCCAIHGDHPWEQRGTITAPELRRSPGAQGDICHGHDTGGAGSACVPVVL